MAPKVSEKISVKFLLYFESSSAEWLHTTAEMARSWGMNYSNINIIVQKNDKKMRKYTMPAYGELQIMLAPGEQYPTLTKGQWWSFYFSSESI